MGADLWGVLIHDAEMGATYLSVRFEVGGPGRQFRGGYSYWISTDGRAGLRRKGAPEESWQGDAAEVDEALAKILPQDMGHPWTPQQFRFACFGWAKGRMFQG